MLRLVKINMVLHWKLKYIMIVVQIYILGAEWNTMEIDYHCSNLQINPSMDNATQVLHNHLK